MTHLFIYRLRIYNDLESIVEELSAIYVKKTLLQIYHEAVSDDYSFLCKFNEQGQTKNDYGEVPEIFNSKLKYVSYNYITVVTLTNSEGRVLTYTNELLETSITVESIQQLLHNRRA